MKLKVDTPKACTSTYHYRKLKDIRSVLEENKSVFPKMQDDRGESELQRNTYLCYSSFLSNYGAAL